MDLQQERAPASGEAVDQIALPEGKPWVERRREQRVDQLVERRLVPGRRDGDVPDMAADVEGIRVAPGGEAEVERRTHCALTIAVEAQQALVEQRDQLLEGHGAVEQGDTAHVQRLGRGFEVEEGRIER